MFDFPNAPAFNQSVVGPHGERFVWDGVKWISAAGPTAPAGSLFLPLSGGTMVGPIVNGSLVNTDTSQALVTATGSTAARHEQDRFADRVNALDFGIICDGVTDQGVQLNAAIASMAPGTTMFIPASVYTTQTILVADGRRLEMPPGRVMRPSGGPTLMVMSNAIIGSASLSPVVLVSGGEGSLVNVAITRNGTPAANSIGLQCVGQDQIYTNVRSYNHARGIQVGAPGAAPVAGYAYSLCTRFDHCMTWNCTSSYMYFINAPETTLYDHRFGMNGATDPGATALVTLDGDNNNATASATNTVSFIRCQFNAGPAQYTVQVLACNYGMFNFETCYSGGVTTAFLYIDPASTRVADVNIVGCEISPLAAGEIFISDTGKKLYGLQIIGNHISGTGAGSSLSLSGVSAQIIGNAFGGTFTLTLDAMTGGACVGNSLNTLNYTGVYTGTFVAGPNSAVTLASTATGSFNYTEPLGNWGSQIVLGKTGQGGRVDFRRGADGVIAGWVGMAGTTIGDVQLSSVGGSTAVRLNANGSGCVFQSVGTEQGRVDANGLGLLKTTVAAVAPGAGFAKLAFIAGTTAGTAKLVAYAGTSATPVTVVDNIGAGF